MPTWSWQTLQTIIPTFLRTGNCPRVSSTSGSAYPRWAKDSVRQRCDGHDHYDRSILRKWKTAREALKRAAHTATHAGYTVSNPVTVAVGYQKLQETGDSQSKLIANLVANVQALKQEIDEMKVMREQASLF